MLFLCVHPNFELYGSDRVFVTAVEALDKAFPDSRVDVLLPCGGPIVDRLAASGGVRTRQMFILRRRGLIQRLIFKSPQYLKAIVTAFREMRRYDFIYINTVIGIDFPLMARFVRRPKIVHVHEIPNGIELWFFRSLLIWSQAALIYNSHATKRAFAMPRGTREYVVYNGSKDPGEHALPDLSSERKLRVLMMGRLNHWKGQDVLVKAISLLGPMRDHVAVRIVGGTFNNQDDFRTNISDLIARLGLEDVVRIEPFTSDTGECYRWADVVTVPSTLPEPFGLVSIEAMAHGRPVIASRHGGLAEIVLDGETGILVEPSNAEALAAAIASLRNDPDRVRRYGRAARARFLQSFAEDRFSNGFLDVIRQEAQGSQRG